LSLKHTPSLEYTCQICDEVGAPLYVGFRAEWNAIHCASKITISNTVVIFKIRFLNKYLPPAQQLTLQMNVERRVCLRACMCVCGGGWLGDGRKVGSSCFIVPSNLAWN